MLNVLSIMPDNALENVVGGMGISEFSLDIAYSEISNYYHWKLGPGSRKFA